MHSSVNEVVGGHVALLRKRREEGLSQVGLASLLSAKLGKLIDPSTVNRLERGKRPVTADELVALGQIFDVEVGDLLRESDPIRSCLAYWDAQIRASAILVAAQRAQLDDLSKQAQVEVEIAEAFSLLDQSRQQFDRAAVVRALDVFIRNRFDLYSHRVQRAGIDAASVRQALELAGISREAIDGADAETEKQLAPWLSGDDAIQAAMDEDAGLRWDDQPSAEQANARFLELIREGLIGHDSQAQ